jgi:TRAP-type mannitol/chloroaromatic compound transport system permease small subunit
MKSLLLFSRWMDAFSDRLGKLGMWLILLTTLISAANAISRKAFDISSNAFLEIQWYLFAAVFLLGGGFAFLRNAHVRIDFLSNKFSNRTRNWIDILGIVVFIVPLCYLMIVLGWPLFERAYQSGEMSSNAGGLIRWPVYLLIPVGFAVLLLQSLSELVKRAAFLTGQGPDVLAHTGPSETQELAKEIAEAEQAKAQQAPSATHS